MIQFGSGDFADMRGHRQAYADSPEMLLVDYDRYPVGKSPVSLSTPM
ncbi:MAG: hypothetical protein IJY50_05230 [Clostridia bacterium]|nr:hypothetical protein [Clostridia bacterium]